jgi:glucan phosphoethanolaminetransferase (alkaline phosphatase superfamily)
MKKKNKTQGLELIKYGGGIALISWLYIVYFSFLGWTYPIRYSLSYFFQYDIAIIFFISSLLFFIGIYLKTKDKIYAISFLLILIGILYYPLPADYIRELTVSPNDRGSLEWYVSVYPEFFTTSYLIYLGIIILIIKYGFNNYKKK